MPVRGIRGAVDVASNTKEEILTKTRTLLEAMVRENRVKAADVAANNYNLDVKNPNRADDYEHLPPEKLADDILAKEQRIAEIMAEIQAMLRVGL